MYLQGNLQKVFDALFHLGVIDPVLEMDWVKALDEATAFHEEISQIMAIANEYQDDMEMLKIELSKFDHKTLSYLAMEVAREFADFHAREEHLH